MLFFGSFDAIVVVSSVYILFPQEHSEYKDNALQHLRWTIERFQTMGNYNPLARAAVGVLKAVMSKLVKAMSNAQASASASAEPPSSGSPSVSSFSTSINTPPGSKFGGGGGGALGQLPMNGATALMGSDLMPTTGSAPMNDAMGFSAPMDEIARMPPFLPLEDLVWHDLSALDADGQAPTSFGDDSLTLDPGALDWQFGGGLGDDNLWQYLNQR